MKKKQRTKPRDITLAHHIARKYRIGSKIADSIGTSRQNVFVQLRTWTPKLERAAKYRDSIKEITGLEFDVIALFARFPYDEAERLISMAVLSKTEADKHSEEHDGSKCAPESRIP